MSDCIALVTGTSSGIGAAIAQALLDADWVVVGLSRRDAAFANPRYRHVPVDLGDLLALEGIGQQTLAPLLEHGRWQRVGLVNNAAAIGAMLPVEAMDPVHLARMFAVNVVAPVYLMGLVVRLTPPAVPLRIVNVSSGAAVRPFPGLLDYASTKAALRMAGMTLAAELQSPERPGGARPDIAILSYSPGIVDTPMQEAARAPDSPWSRPFVEFHAQGLLQRPQAPAAEVARFLDGDGHEPHAERRFEAP